MYYYLELLDREKVFYETMNEFGAVESLAWHTTDELAENDIRLRLLKNISLYD